MDTKTRTKPALLAPHMVPLAGIAALAGINFSTFKRLEDSVGLKTPDFLRLAVGYADLIPMMKLKQEHVTEVSETSTKLVDAMYKNDRNVPTLVTQLAEHLLDAGNQLINNNQAKHNGAADHQHSAQHGTADRPAQQQ